MAEVTTRKRGDKWEYRFESAKVNGMRRHITKSGFKTKSEAIKSGTKALAEYNTAGLHFIPSEISFNDYLDYWLKEYCEINLKRTTVDGYIKKINLHIRPELGKYHLKSITPAILNSFLNTKFNEGFSRNSLVVFKGILSRAFNYAVEPLKFISDTPMIYVKLPLARAEAKVPTRKKERTVISKDSMKLIFERFPERHPAHLPLLMAYSCGLRLGEAFAIDLENDIDFENSYLIVNHQVQFLNGCWTLVKPKYDSIRKVKLDNMTLEKLKRAKELHFDSINFYKEYYSQIKLNSKNQLNYIDGTPVHLLCSRDDGTYIQPRIMCHTGRVIHYDLNIMDYDYHSLRHTHATMLLEAGINPKVVQERLGHKNIETTLQVYTHVTEQMTDTAIKQIENVLVF